MQKRYTIPGQETPIPLGQRWWTQGKTKREEPFTFILLGFQKDLESCLTIWIYIQLKDMAELCECIFMAPSFQRPLLKRDCQNCKFQTIFAFSDSGERCQYTKCYGNFLCWFSFRLTLACFGYFLFYIPEWTVMFMKGARLTTWGN